MCYNSRGASWFEQVDVDLEGCSDKGVHKVRTMLADLIDTVGVCMPGSFIRDCKPMKGVDCTFDLVLSAVQNWDYKYLTCS